MRPGCSDPDVRALSADRFDLIPLTPQFRNASLVGEYCTAERLFALSISPDRHGQGRAKWLPGLAASFAVSMVLVDTHV